MFARPEITIPIALLQANAETARNAPKLMQVAFERGVRNLRRNIVQELAAEPGAPKYPIRWTSIRQKKAFFASKGFGRGIPSVRTHAFSKGWKTTLTISPDGGLFTIVNDVPYRRFVSGLTAQPMHIATGWPQEVPIVAKYQELAAIVVKETWFTVTDIRAGVR